MIELVYVGAILAHGMPIKAIAANTERESQAFYKKSLFDILLTSESRRATSIPVATGTYCNFFDFISGTYYSTAVFNFLATEEYSCPFTNLSTI